MARVERRRRAGAVTEFAKTIEDLAHRAETAWTDADEQGSLTVRDSCLHSDPLRSGS